MYWKKLAMLCAICAICAGTAEAQEKSWMKITRETETVVIAVRYQETGLQSDQFIVEATKEGAGGTSISKQGGLLESLNSGKYIGQ